MKVRSALLGEILVRFLKWTATPYYVNVLGKVYISSKLVSLEKWSRVLDQVGQILGGFTEDDKSVIKRGIKYIVVVANKSNYSYVSYKYKSYYLCEKQIYIDRPDVLACTILGAAKEVVAQCARRKKGSEGQADRGLP